MNTHWYLLGGGLEILAVYVSKLQCSVLTCRMQENGHCSWFPSEPNC